MDHCKSAQSSYGACQNLVLQGDARKCEVSCVWQPVSIIPGHQVCLSGAKWSMKLWTRVQTALFEHTSGNKLLLSAAGPTPTPRPSSCYCCSFKMYLKVHDLTFAGICPQHSASSSCNCAGSRMPAATFHSLVLSCLDMQETRTRPASGAYLGSYLQAAPL